MLKIGDSAPAFTLPDSDGKKVSLSDYKGQYVVLYFYPKDNTPGCTIEGIDFTRLLPEFKKLKTAVLGVSTDSLKSHCKFRDKHKLSVTLLSDEEKVVCKKYEIWKPKKFMGMEFLGVLRTTFLIDPKGKIAYIWDKVSVTGHAQEVVEKIKEMK